MSVLLVCEGVCGQPYTQRWDESVRNAPRLEGRPILSLTELSRSIRLVHTPHVHTGQREHTISRRQVFACSVCGNRRAYGWPAPMEIGATVS